MHLWNEYEGRTVAGSYTLGKLLRSEGRNGFFSTSTDKGNPAVIRITEAHFDEEEQLKRWREVAEVQQSNLIGIEGMGKTTFDGVALTYAVMEPSDANLSDVLQERPLTPAETTDVAKSVLAALRALHANGLVHGHIDPSNVLAVGNTVKLRSDCVRECVADGEFNTPESCAELRQRDLHDYGILLLQCLTLEKEWTAGTQVPEPFRRIVPRALDGSLTAEGIAAIIDPGSIVPEGVNARPLPAVPSPGASKSAVSQAATPAYAASTSYAGAAYPRAAQAPGREPLPSPSASARVPLPAAAEEHSPESPALRFRSYADADEPASSQVSMRTIWAVCGASAVVLLLLIWHFVSGKPAASHRPVAPAVAQTTAPAAAPMAVPPAERTAAPRPARAAAETAPATHTAAGPGWYVIAFTYNHQGQAATKAEHINRRHGGLHAEVFNPSGHGPYLVALNGPMSENEAESLWRRARRDGLPRDTFVRHY